MKGDKGISCRLPMKLLYIKVVEGTCSPMYIVFWSIGPELDLSHRRVYFDSGYRYLGASSNGN